MMSSEASQSTQSPVENSSNDVLNRIGCVSVCLFEGGGAEAKFQDGSLIHLAPCASSFLLQLPPHKDTPYGCGLHKIEYKTKFPTSLCRSKVHELINLRNKLCNEANVYIHHGTTRNSNVAAQSLTSDTHSIWSPRVKKLPKWIEQYTWQYENIKRSSDGSLALCDSEHVAVVTLKPHRQTFEVEFLAPRIVAHPNTLASPGFEPGTPRSETSGMSPRSDVVYSALSSRCKTVANKEDSLNGLRLNLMQELEDCSDGEATPQAASHNTDGTRAMGNDGKGEKKKNWVEYVWVTQLYSVLDCPLCWRAPLNLLVHFARHSFINGPSDGITPKPVVSQPNFAEMVLPESCCSAYLHPWRRLKGFMESRDATTLWDNYPIRSFIVPGYVFRVIAGNYSRDDTEATSFDPCVEVDLPDGSLLRSEASDYASDLENLTAQSNSKKTKSHFLTHFTYKSSIANVKSVTISLSSPPPKVPGQLYDIAKVGKQAFELLHSLSSSSTSGSTTAAPQRQTCIQNQSSSFLDSSSVYINSARSDISSVATPRVSNSTFDSSTPLTTPRPSAPFVTEQAQVEGVGEFWAFSTGRIRVAFCDGVFLDMKLQSTGHSPGYTDGLETPRRAMKVGSSTSAADLPVGLARMLMKDGSYQFVNVNSAPSQFTRYLLAAGEWVQWVTCPEEDRETVFTSVNHIQQMVQSELDKIKRFNYMSDNAVKFPLQRPDPVGGPTVDELNKDNIGTPSPIATSSDHNSSFSKSAPNGGLNKDNIGTPSPIATSSDHNSSFSKSAPNGGTSFDLDAPMTESRNKLPDNAMNLNQNCSLEKRMPQNKIFGSKQKEGNKEEKGKHRKFAWKIEVGDEYENDSKQQENTPRDAKKSSQVWTKGIRESWRDSKETQSPFYEVPDKNKKVSKAKANYSTDLETEFVKNEENLAGEKSQSVASQKKTEVVADEKSSQLKQNSVQDSSENTAALSECKEKRKKTSKTTQPKYNQSELQSEIQKIIQKTRQDLELYAGGKSESQSLGSLTENKQNSDEKLDSMTEKQNRSDKMESLTGKKTEGEKSRAKDNKLQPTRIVNQKDHKQSANVKSNMDLKRVANVVPPPLQFSDDSNMSVNVSMISRPKSPPMDKISAVAPNDSNQSITSSPPRSPPGHSQLLTFDPVRLKQTNANSNDTHSPNVTALQQTNSSQSCSNEIRDLFTKSRSTKSEKFVFDVSNTKDTESSCKQLNKVAKSTKEKDNHVNSPQVQRKQPDATSVLQSNEQKRSNDSQDIDQFLLENSAGLNPQFDFASVTDALFKTQQAIKTIEQMLHKRDSNENESNGLKEDEEESDVSQSAD